MAVDEQRDRSLGGRIHRTGYPLLRFMRTRDTAFLSLFMAALLVAWGIVLVNPSTDTFRFIRQVTTWSLFDGQYEIVWGIVAIIIGGGLWSATLYDLVLFQCVLAVANTLFWLMCLIFFQILAPYTLGPVISFTIVTFSLCISIRTAERYFILRQRHRQGSRDGHVQ